MPDDKKSYAWIIYLGIAAAFAIVGYAIYSYINNNAANAALKACQDNATILLQDYQTQYDTYQKQNGNVPLSQQQLNVLDNLYNNYANAEQGCLTVAAQVNAVNALTSPWLIVAAAISIPIGLAIGSAIRNKFGRNPKFPGEDTQAVRNTTTVAKVQSGEMTADEGAANLDQSASIARNEVAVDSGAYTTQIADLEAQYAYAQASLLEVETELTDELAVSDEITIETTLLL